MTARWSTERQEGLSNRLGYARSLPRAGGKKPGAATHVPEGDPALRSSSTMPGLPPARVRWAGRRRRKGTKNLRRRPTFPRATADRLPSSAGHGERGRQGGWRTAFVAAIAAELDALIGTERADTQDFEALEQVLRRQVSRPRRAGTGTALQRRLHRRGSRHRVRAGARRPGPGSGPRLVQRLQLARRREGLQPVRHPAAVS